MWNLFQTEGIFLKGQYTEVFRVKITFLSLMIDLILANSADPD